MEFDKYRFINLVYIKYNVNIEYIIHTEHLEVKTEFRKILSSYKIPKKG